MGYLAIVKDDAIFDFDSMTNMTVFTYYSVFSYVGIWSDGSIIINYTWSFDNTCFIYTYVFSNPYTFFYLGVIIFIYIFF